jgi:hypothetical protein
MRRPIMRSDNVFSTSSLQAYLSLVFLCGAALAASIQPATHIAALNASDLAYPPGLFPISFVFFFGLFSINRGAVIAAHSAGRLSKFKLSLRFLEHIGYGLILLAPYFVFSRALLPNGAADLLILVLYTATSSLFFCLLSFRFERRGDHRKEGAFLLRYGCYFAFCLVPFGLGISHSSLSLFVIASPVGFAARVTGGASALELITGMLVPVLGIMWILTRTQRFDRRHHAV